MDLTLPSFQFRFMKALGNVIFPGNFHPLGTQRGIQQMVARLECGRVAAQSGGNWLIVGGSGGFGSALRGALGVRLACDTLSVSYDAQPNPESGNKIRKIGGPGYHRNIQLERQLRARGRVARSIDGDVFDPAIVNRTIETIRTDLPRGRVDGLVWSLAAPRAFDPRTGETISSVLKPYGAPASVRTFSSADEPGGPTVGELEILPGSPAEAVATQYVMGGGIVERWVDALVDAGVLAEGCRLLTISYRGCHLNEAVYHKGMIGLAKADLEFVTKALDGVLRSRIGGRALVVQGPAVVTEASGGIPGVPFYMALLADVLGARFEDPVASMARLVDEHLSPGRDPVLDEEGMIRMDGRELDPQVLAEMEQRWASLPPGASFPRALYDEFMRAYARTRGFQVEGVDYAAPFDIDAVNAGEIG